MGRTLSGRPASGAGKRTADDKSAARWFDWQGPTGSQNGRPRTADVSRGKGGSVRLTVMQAAAAQAAAEAQVHDVATGEDCEDFGNEECFQLCKHAAGRDGSSYICLRSLHDGSRSSHPSAWQLFEVSALYSNHVCATKTSVSGFRTQIERRASDPRWAAHQSLCVTFCVTLNQACTDLVSTIDGSRWVLRRTKIRERYARIEMRLATMFSSQT